MILFPVRGGTISQKFGENPDFYKSRFGINGHNGVDIVSFHRDSLFACEDGTVFKVYDLKTGSVTKGFGLYLLGDSDKDGVCNVWVYWHTMSNIKTKSGDRVKTGDIIAFEGASGQVYEDGVEVPDDKKGVFPYPGTHLHWGYMKAVRTKEVKNRALSDITGNVYWDKEGFAYEVLDYDNGTNGYVDPLTTNPEQYGIWKLTLLSKDIVTNAKTMILEPKATVQDKLRLLDAVRDVLLLMMKTISGYFKGRK